MLGDSGRFWRIPDDSFGDSFEILLGFFRILGVYDGRWGFLRILEDSWHYCGDS